MAKKWLREYGVPATTKKWCRVGELNDILQVPKHPFRWGNIWGADSKRPSVWSEST